MTEQVVQIGNHTLYCGDAYKLMPSIGRQDALITDPPYEFNTSGGGQFRAQRPNMDAIANCGIDKGFDLSILSWKWAKQIVCFCHNDQLGKIIDRMKQGFHRHVVLAWHKTNPMPVANQHYVPDTEFFVHAWQKGSAPVGQISELGRYILGPVGKSEHDHPTVKPDYVMDKILRNVAGETIVDCFMGSGSTGVAAVRAGRTFIGVEHNPKHFELACQRIKAAVQEGCDHA